MRVSGGETLRVFPLSDWTELDVWRYIEGRNVSVVPLYFSAPRPTVERDGAILMVDDERFRFADGEMPVERRIRFRTLGCYPLSGAIESEAASAADIFAELTASSFSERQSRLIDREPSASMEMKKQAGYF
jgi:sulfate adenylyltransferase subunit 2